MLRALSLLLLTCALCSLASPNARGRGGGAAVNQHLLEKGLGELRRAEAAWFRKDFAAATRRGRAAEQLFADVLIHTPQHREAALLGAQAATFAGDGKGAKQWVLRYMRLSPAGEGDPGLHYLRAFVHLLADDRPDRALRSLLRMYSLNARVRPSERDTLWYMALLNLGGRYLKAGKPLEAANHFSTGARIARRLGNQAKELLMLANLGVAYMRDDRNDEAAEVYKGLAKLEPGNALWVWRLGMALANQNRFGDAAAAYRRVLVMQKAGAAIAAPDEIAKLPLRLGNCLRHMSVAESDPQKSAQLLAEAQKNIETYVKAHPRDPAGPSWLGVLFQENRDMPYKALVQFKRAFALDPMCESVLRRMIQVHGRHPAPEGSDSAAWAKTRTAMEKDLREGAKRRATELEQRKTRTGGTGCS